MEYVDGADLRTVMRSKSSSEPALLSMDEIRHVGSQIVSALHYLHQKLIVHMDIKPENIMIQKDTNVAKLIDFGVS